MLHERNPTNKSRTECGLDVRSKRNEDGARCAVGYYSDHVKCPLCRRNRALRAERGSLTRTKSKADK